MSKVHQVFYHLKNSYKFPYCIAVSLSNVAFSMLLYPLVKSFFKTSLLVTLFKSILRLLQIVVPLWVSALHSLSCLLLYRCNFWHTTHNPRHTFGVQYRWNTPWWLGSMAMHVQAFVDPRAQDLNSNNLS